MADIRPAPGNPLFNVREGVRQVGPPDGSVPANSAGPESRGAVPWDWSDPVVEVEACRFETKAGGACKMRPLDGKDYCLAHRTRAEAPQE